MGKVSSWVHAALLGRSAEAGGLTAISWLRLVNYRVQKPQWGSFLNYVASAQSLLTSMDTEDLAVHSGGGHTAASGVILGPQPGVPLGKGRAMGRNVLWAEVTAQPLAGPS